MAAALGAGLVAPQAGAHVGKRLELDQLGDVARRLALLVGAGEPLELSGRITR